MIKQVIIIRKDLNMRKGKMVAQGAHASMAAILNNMRNGQTHIDYKPQVINGKYFMTLEVKENSPLDQWLRGSFTKICVSVNSEQELLDVYNKAKELNMSCSLIQDSGFTEFHGVPTYTAVAIGPDDSGKIDVITGNLPLL
jgi:PTH2 family peptidyl-tRNA hydrolase